MSNNNEYTVILRGQRFTLSKDQIENDAPNYFTSCFLGDFKEGKSREVTLGRNPMLFAFIVEHLSGYDILPLATDALPPTMTLEVALKNLIADALFYSLDDLHKRLTNALALIPSLKPPEYDYFMFVIDAQGLRSNTTAISEPVAFIMAKKYGIANAGTERYNADFQKRFYGRDSRLVASWAEGSRLNVILSTPR